MATEPTTNPVSDTYLSLEKPALRQLGTSDLPTSGARRVHIPNPAKGEEDSVVLSEKARALSELAARDREVRAHEAAHAAVGGPYAGSPSYTYQTGPDGRRYAIGGEVQIDVSPVAGDPQATLEKARVIRAAALAPAEPSAADRAIAAKAAGLAAKAQAELAQEEQAPASERKSAQPSEPANIQPIQDPSALPGRLLNIRA